MSAVEEYSDAELVHLAKQGSREALEQLLRRYERFGILIAQRFMRHPEDVEDAVQQAFIKVMRGIRYFDGRSAFSTWLFRIIRNTCLDVLRAKRLHLPLEPAGRDDGDDLTPEAASLAPGPEEICERRELSALVHRAVRELPEYQRTVLLLHYMEDLSIGQIAARLSVKPVTVRTRLHRARERLRDILEPMLREYSLA